MHHRPDPQRPAAPDDGRGTGPTDRAADRPADRPADRAAERAADRVTDRTGDRAARWDRTADRLAATAPHPPVSPGPVGAASVGAASIGTGPLGTGPLGAGAVATGPLAAASVGAGSTEYAEGAARWAERRTPRGDVELRERPARGALPGWLAVLVVAAAAVGAVLVQASSSGLPDWVPGGSALHLGPHGGPGGTDGASLSRTSAALLLGGCGTLALLAFFGLLANPVGCARVLSRFGGYRGTVRRAGLVWVNPFLRRTPMDVRIRHWRSEPIDATDREGSPIRAELLLVWQVRDTARARFAVADHERHLAAAAESVLCRAASLLPCDSFAAPGPSLRDGQWLGGELTRMLAAEMAPAGVAVFSVQAVALDYLPEFAAPMRRRRIAELEAGTREVIVGDALETAALAVSHLERGQGVALDDAFRAGLVRDLVTAFLTLPPTPPGPAGTAGAAGKSGATGKAGKDGAARGGADSGTGTPAAEAAPAPGTATAVPAPDPADVLRPGRTPHQPPADRFPADDPRDADGGGRSDEFPPAPRAHEDRVAQDVPWHAVTGATADRVMAQAAAAFTPAPAAATAQAVHTEYTEYAEHPSSAEQLVVDAWSPADAHPQDAVRVFAPATEYVEPEEYTEYAEPVAWGVADAHPQDAHPQDAVPEGWDAVADLPPRGDARPLRTLYRAFGGVGAAGAAGMVADASGVWVVPAAPAAVEAVPGSRAADVPEDALPPAASDALSDDPSAPSAPSAPSGTGAISVPLSVPLAPPVAVPVPARPVPGTGTGGSTGATRQPLPEI